MLPKPVGSSFASKTSSFCTLGIIQVVCLQQILEFVPSKNTLFPRNLSSAKAGERESIVFRTNHGSPAFAGVTMPVFIPPSGPQAHANSSG